MQGFKKSLPGMRGFEKPAWNWVGPRVGVPAEGLVSCLRMQVFPEKKSLETVFDEYCPDMYIYIYICIFELGDYDVYYGFRV